MEVIVTPLPTEAHQEIVAKFKGMPEGLVEVGETRHRLPSHCTNYINKYREFRFRDDDVLLMTFPRSGTTWTQELVWTMRNGLDFSTAKSKRLPIRSPFLEYDSLNPLLEPYPNTLLAMFTARHPGKDPRKEGVFLDLAENAPSPRTIKTHLPFSMMPPDLLEKCKVVYVARNPRDVCVSYYHHQRLVNVAKFTGNFPDFLDLWCRDLVLQGPYWSHLEEAWASRGHRNLHFVFYEDMKENLMREMRRLDTFLGTGLTDDQLRQVADYADFGKMKTRESSNPFAARVAAGALEKGQEDFIRKGLTGDWISYFTPELEAKFQAWEDAGGKVARDIPFRYQLRKTE